MNKKRLVILTMILLIIVLLCFITYFLITRNYMKNISNNLPISSGDGEHSAIQQSGEDLELGSGELFTEETYPRIDGSTATIPLSEAFKAEFLGKDLSEVSVEHNTTHYAYVNLIDGKADLILATYPSEEEIQLAKDNEVELEIIPVVNEAFVFLTNIKNPVKSLTLEQVQKIYTGEITNWKEVGGKDEKIKAYQREKNSGSQTGMINLVMKDKKMMEPQKEDITLDFMSELIGKVSEFDNSESAIGYSYYYYANTMYETINKEVIDRVNLLAINGVKPTNENIKNGTYPIITNYYIVINKNEPEDGNVRKLVNAMLSERGQKAAEAAGYVGM